jgi:(p)ppGpp synthase/HD superfamily hydrolase
MNESPERILQAAWNDAPEHTHSVEIDIEASDRAGLLQDVMNVCAEMRTQVSSVNARVKKDIATIGLTAQISDLDHLHTLLRKFSNIKDVREVYRVTKREARASG